MMREAETGVMQPQAQGCLEPWQGRVKKDPPLEANRDCGRDKGLKAHTALPGAQLEGVLGQRPSWRPPAL